ncbi:glucose 1-dehydrogenase [Chryseobacterium sp. 09-1422]|uniref:Glucose 1-dehydrogenase n=1 Tax=Chryseobacterium kimseyorum TaxID=2984028 RepID=A0ABT3I2K9_9FLAO|nr:glucose 1-dehydrogenase [Chryseobacterium kimseyorum]MCW3170301.1 glucose 1-dehydrogenase [Chryseobacterium kimseyorum]
MSVNINLEGKVAIVTGAAGGIGLAVVALLIEAGANIIAEDKSENVYKLENQYPGNVYATQGEVSERATARRAVYLATEKFGGVDILVNNAGRSFPKAFLEIRDEDWDSVMADNVKGMFVHASEAVPSMIARGGGTIVNTDSISGLVGIANLVTYCTSKGAVSLFTKSLAVELAPENIRVNAVAPGVIETPILDSLVLHGREVLRNEGTKEPIGRAGQPEEIANVILFLSSSLSSFMTGTIVVADGGYTAK